MSSYKKKKKLFDGKTKALYETDNPEQLILAFKDELGGENGEVIEKKGEINNQVSALLFRYLDGYHIPTHFIHEVGKDAMLVRQLNMIALTITAHYMAFGAHARRLGVKDGAALQPSIIEFYLKDESAKKTALDRKDVQSLGLLSAEELPHIVRIVTKAGVLLQSFFSRRGLMLTSCKFEFGRYKNRLWIGDELSLATCTLRDAATGESFDWADYRNNLAGLRKAYQALGLRILTRL